MEVPGPISGTHSRWSEEEDRILRTYVEQYTEQGCATDWNRVAEKLPFRTNKCCRKRWVNHTCGGLKKGPWEPDEDMCLREAIEQHGQKWTLVASEVGSRSPDQCAKRWQHNLDPRLNRQRWVLEEDELLLKSVDRYGRQWRRIQKKHYGTRSANDLKNRFSLLTKKITSKSGASFKPGLDPGQPCSSSRSAVDVQNQEGISSGTDSGASSRLNSILSHEEGLEGVYNPRDLDVDMSEMMQPIPNVQQRWGQQMQRQEQAATLLPLNNNDQSMTSDFLACAFATSDFPWTTCTAPPSGTCSRPLANGEFPDAILSSGLATMSQNPYHIETDAGDSNMSGSNNIPTGNSNAGSRGPVFGADTLGPAPDGMEQGHLSSLLAQRASRLGTCSPGGSVCLQTKGCDREVLNYLFDVLLPIRSSVKIEINV